MQELIEAEKNYASYLYCLGNSPDKIVEEIQCIRTQKEFTFLNMKIHRFLMAKFKKQMYPVEVYGRLEDIEKEEKEDGRI